MASLSVLRVLMRLNKRNETNRSIAMTEYQVSQLNNARMSVIESLVSMTGTINREDMCCGFYAINRIFDAASKGVYSISILYSEIAEYSETFLMNTRLTNVEIERSLKTLHRYNVCFVQEWIGKSELTGNEHAIILDAHDYA